MFNVLQVASASLKQFIHLTATEEQTHKGCEKEWDRAPGSQVLLGVNKIYI